MDTQQESIRTVVLHHTVRPFECLMTVLRSLRKATELPHDVEVVIQGPAEDVPWLPDTSEWGYNLHRVDNGENLGVGPAVAAAVDRFLKTDARWFCQIDDDMQLPARGWDVLIECIKEEQKTNKIDRAMMGTPRSKPRAFTITERPNSSPVLAMKTEFIGERRKSASAEWVLCEWVDRGCTLHDRLAFEDGILPDPQFFVGSFSLDFGWQALQRGYKSVLCTKPRVNHRPVQCFAKAHEKVRRGPVLVRKNAHKFLDKWNLDFVELTRFRL